MKIHCRSCDKTVRYVTLSRKNQMVNFILSDINSMQCHLHFVQPYYCLLYRFPFFFHTRFEILDAFEYTFTAKIFQKFSVIVRYGDLASHGKTSIFGELKQAFTTVEVRGLSGNYPLILSLKQLILINNDNVPFYVLPFGSHNLLPARVPTCGRYAMSCFIRNCCILAMNGRWFCVRHVRSF